MNSIRGVTTNYIALSSILTNNIGIRSTCNVNSNSVGRRRNASIPRSICTNEIREYPAFCVLKILNGGTICTGSSRRMDSWNPNYGSIPIKCLIKNFAQNMTRNFRPDVNVSSAPCIVRQRF